MLTLQDLEKKINSELTTKINSSKISHSQIYISIDSEDIVDVILFLKNNEKIKLAYKAWGFKDIDDKLMKVLNKWALFLYDPILKNEVRKIQDSDSGIYGAKIAGEVHKELRKYGGVKPPREFVFMDRAAVGLGSIFIHLKAEINWYKLFHELIKDFSVKNLETSQKNAIAFSKKS